MLISLPFFRKLGLIIITTACISSCQHDQSISKNIETVQASEKLASVTRENNVITHDFSAHWISPSLILLPKSNIHQKHTLILTTIS